MTKRTNCHAALLLLLTLVLLSLSAVTSSAQKANKLEIEHWREVLRSVERELKETYYDPTFNGIDIGARFKLADAKMKNADPMEVGIMRAMPVAISATYADVIMADGTKLERMGVTPDKLILPTPQDMSMGHDPVLAHAASLAGIALDPKRAGLLLTSR